MQSNPYESRYGTPERPVPEPSDPLEEEARKEAALADERRDEHDGPGPVYSPEGADDPTADETRRVHVLGSGATDTGTGTGDVPPDSGETRDTVYGDTVYGDAVPVAADTGRADTGRADTGLTDTGHAGTADPDDDDPLDRHGSENADSRETSETDDVLAPEPVRSGDGGTPPVADDSDVLVAGPAARERGAGDETEPVDDVDFERSWREIKAGFVDDPRGSVEQADGLVEAAVAVFTGRRQSLLDKWKNSDQADTEALRLALREYHALLAQLTGK
ncbi:hypothetical protein [Planotetraspora kaengkrachanensis]|uniref:Uncharacterized protein n=1 Tax=Planotetraspora kaengkrachanensis TaxID=575193 RepID=A0A8J3M0M3_9ACTN|nr:hypothetical protein [Planotetraspora kaengkrachanensis]GIG76881.1 hypothetical protein Pka01_00080 [Planotetraspora kaengkrachanensis]